MIDKKRIEEIKERCEKATQGEWKVVANKSFGVQSENKNIACCFRAENEQFIAHARQDIPYLLAELERLNSNEPLTLDELRQMNEEPVWIQTGRGGHWELSADAQDYFDDRDPDFYGMECHVPGCSSPCQHGLHQLGWLAYKRKPEKGDNT